MTSDPLIDLMFERLSASDLSPEASEALLRALCGDTAPAPGADPDSRPQPTGPYYLSAITVAGFRGIGPEQKLEIRPGPGVTLVVGRNGSGKSSFAEAAELALTGDSARWADRNSVWREGWRNLHRADPCRIEVDLRVDGHAEPLRVQRRWQRDAGLDDAQATVADPAGRGTSLEDLDLARPLGLYRPFLTAAEMGRLVSGTPSKLFDAIYAILGLDALPAADSDLRDRARPLEAAVKEHRARRSELVAQLATVDDERARRAADLLAKRQPDLDALEGLLAEPTPATGDAETTLATRLAALAVPDPAEVARLADALAAADADAGRHLDARAESERRSAELLALALAHAEETPDAPCPVCGVGTLDRSWRESATGTLARLADATHAATRAAFLRDTLTGRIRQLIGTLPVPDGELPGVPVGELRDAVAALREAAPDPAAEPSGHPTRAAGLAAHLRDWYPVVAEAAAAAREGAAAWLHRHDAPWQQASLDLRLWLREERSLPERQRELAALKEARAWLRATSDAIRDQRVAPFAEHSQRIWSELRQESNVRLGTMALAGTATRRRVEFPVSVDGAENAALGVMSQGEMHALGLATFLPRSCADESPFRFVVIDDPVQSMDPAKVDGLARVLAELAGQRQVVVFTHDSRLRDAMDRLEIDADVVEVVRSEQSVVQLRPSSDPVTRYLDDARAAANSGEVDEAVRFPVVAELCRCAIEATFQRMVWKRRLARGDRHGDIEAAIKGAGRLSTLAALAFFDDPDRGGEVLNRLNRIGPWAANAYQACRRGVHGRYHGDLRDMVRDTRGLVGNVR
jgi:energy-coupling factor transporter ATP-binding protein EcfA2